MLEMSGWRRGGEAQTRAPSASDEDNYDFLLTDRTNRQTGGQTNRQTDKIQTSLCGRESAFHSFVPLHSLAPVTFDIISLLVPSTTYM